MSSWLDLIDDASLDRFVAASGTSDHEAAVPATASTNPTETLRDSEAWGLSMISHVPDDDVASSLTILPSVASSGAQPDGLGNSITMLDDFVSVDDEASSSLSLHPDSVESSVMTDFTEDRMISSVSSDEASQEDDLSIASRDERSVLTNPEATPVGTVIRTGSPTKASGDAVDSQLKQWYSKFQTEGDWDEFRTAAYELLQAVNCPEDERDKVMAQLIAQEEDAFWDKTNRSACSPELAEVTNSNWLVNLVAGVGVVALTGVALVRLLKGR